MPPGAESVVAVADLRRTTRWAGLRPGDPVQVGGTRLRGRVVGVRGARHQRGDRRGLGRGGGRAGRRPGGAVVPAGPALRVVRPAGARPFAGRRARAPARLTATHGPPRHPDADHAAARAAALRPRRPRRARRHPRRGVVLVVPASFRHEQGGDGRVPRSVCSRATRATASGSRR